MTTGNLLDIQPSVLKFTFELMKQSTCSLHLVNMAEHHVAFKVKTTNPKKYAVRPNTGVVMPGSSCDMAVTMQAQREAPPDMRCKDKFLVQTVIVNECLTAKDITREMFTKESGNIVKECKMGVVYLPPPQLSLTVLEEAEGSAPNASFQEENGNFGSSLYDSILKASDEAKENHSEVLTLISALISERASAIQRNKKLQQDLELLQRESGDRHQGFSILFVILAGWYLGHPGGISCLDIGCCTKILLLVSIMV